MSEFLTFRKKIGQVLYEKGLVPEETLKKALEMQENTPNKFLGELLIDMGAIDKSSLLATLAEQFGVDTAKPDEDVSRVNPKLMSKFPRDILKRYMMFPLSVKNNVLTIVIANPANLDEIRSILSKVPYKLRFLLGMKSDIKEILFRYFSMSLAVSEKSGDDDKLTHEINASMRSRRIENAQSMTGRKKIGEMLTESGVLSAEQLQKALDMQSKSAGRLLGEILLAEEMIKENDFFNVLASQMGIPFIDFDSAPPPPENGYVLPYSLMERLYIFPAKVDKNTLLLATIKPMKKTIDLLEKAYAWKVNFALTTEEAIHERLEAFSFTRNTEAYADHLTALRRSREEEYIEKLSRTTDAFGAHELSWAGRKQHESGGFLADILVSNNIISIDMMLAMIADSEDSSSDYSFAAAVKDVDISKDDKSAHDLHSPKKVKPLSKVKFKESQSEEIIEEVVADDIIEEETIEEIVEEEIIEIVPEAERPKTLSDLLQKGSESPDGSGSGHTSSSDRSSREFGTELAPVPMPSTSELSLDKLLEQASLEDASDLHLSGSRSPMIRRFGRIVPLRKSPLPPDRLDAILLEALSESQKETLESDRSLDFACERGRFRFRGNIFYKQQHLGAVFRLIKRVPENLKSINLPDCLTTLTERTDGLILVTGPTGSGKSTTLAAMINMINNERQGHIITVEDPVEFMHEDHSCIISQREIGIDADSYARALKDALREDPDVILIGEMRDIETVSMALTAAETGHLVFSSVHTTSAVKTINRILNMFPEHQITQARNQLSDTLAGVIAQTLIPKADGEGMVPALEILIGTRAVSNIIREGRLENLENEMLSRRADGMRTLDVSLAELYEKDLISKKDVKRKCRDLEKFSKLLSDGKSFDFMNSE